MPNTFTCVCGAVFSNEEIWRREHLPFCARLGRKSTVVACGLCHQSFPSDEQYRAHLPTCPNRIGPDGKPVSTQGIKFDDGKPRFALLPVEPLLELVRVFTLGAKKYEDRNWEKGIAFDRIFSAAQRHLWAWWGGQDIDPETGLSHLAHAAWGCVALMELLKTHPELDTRPRKPEVRHDAT